MVDVSAEDRWKFEQQARTLDEAGTDDPGTAVDRRRMLDLINRLRIARGREPFPDPEEEPPELEFFRKAEARGMVAARDWGPGGTRR